MKKIHKLFTLLLTSVFIISCSSDDNSISDEQGFEKQILGAWNVVSIVEDGYEFKLDKCALDNSKMFIFPDNTIKDQYGEFYDNECHVSEDNYIYKILGDVIYMNSIDNESESRLKFKLIENNTLVMTRIYLKDKENPAEEFEDSEARVITFKR